MDDVYEALEVVLNEDYIKEILNNNAEESKQLHVEYLILQLAIVWKSHQVNGRLGSIFYEIRLMNIGLPYH